MRIDLNPFSGAAAVAVPVDPLLFQLAAARWPINWQCGGFKLRPPEGLTHVLFWIETPCADRGAAEAWAGENYLDIYARVRRSLLTTPFLN